MRKVLGVTGIRSDYDIMSSVFRAIDDRDDLEPIAGWQILRHQLRHANIGAVIEPHKALE